VLNINTLSLGSKVLGYKLFRMIHIPKMLPLGVTVSVTNVCNSKCQTCYIWSLYREKPWLKGKELKTDEFEKIFESIGRNAVWITISGGEPYLRPDLVRICEAAYEHCRPKFLIVPTNCLLPSEIEYKTKKILETYRDSEVVVNLSLDGVDKKHDAIRGVLGNFEKVIVTYDKLRRLRKEYPNFKIGIHSVASRFNINNLLELYEFAKRLEPDTYICEIAEPRNELFNIDKEIAPDISEYENFIKELSKKIKRDYFQKRGLVRLIQAYRLKYYQLAVRELKEKRQVIPCYAGFASCQISSYGDVWPCCILAYNAEMGNLRDTEYNFRKVWFSEQAEKVRRNIKGGQCYCPMANVHYTNVLCNFRALLGVLKNLLV